MFNDIYWLSSLTMEEVFLVTGLALVIIGTVGGLIMCKVVKKFVEENEDASHDT